MKKILWICNTPLPEIQDELGIRNYNEGWLVGISNQLKKRKDIEFYYAFPQEKYKRIFMRTIDRIHFIGFSNFHKNLYSIEQANINTFSTIIKKVNPDIIHIFGTELPHCLECVSSVQNKTKIVISIQGLTSEISKKYVKDISLYDMLRGKFFDGKYRCILEEKYEFFRRGINEKKALQNVTNVIGRTEWDKKCVKLINSKCKYYFCNETLRETFYEGKWDINKIQRHSIFVSQAYYPIKGLHIMIPALPMIKEKYPDVKVYVGGNKSFLEDTAYGIYINKLIKFYNVDENIIFLGYLNTEKVKQRLMLSHIMLMPSLIENSPNSIGEAMIVGTPVVAANVGGISSILRHNREGYLYPCLNIKKMVERICEVFMYDDIALRFSENGQKWARKLYDQSKNLNQLLKIYECIEKKA